MLFYQRPLHVVRAEGVWLYEADGKRTLDAYNNVPSIGHCHPAVVNAVSRQIGILNTHTRYLYDGVYTYAEQLLATMPAELANIVFTCTGSESADFAVRAARGLTGGTGFIVTENAYHGNTLAATEISPASASAESPPQHVSLVPAPDTYHGGNEGLEQRLQACVRRSQAMARAIKLAGFMADSIFSSDGVFPGARGFSNQPSTRFDRPAGYTLQMRCNRALQGRVAACGASFATVSCQTWSSWASRWGMAFR